MITNAPTPKLLRVLFVLPAWMPFLLVTGFS